jgi:hypothetical protein
MDAAPLLIRIARLLDELHLDAILIGNAAAALEGAPVTTVGIDFLFRKTPASLRKLKALASGLGAVILRPYYPASGLYRVARDEDGLQLDFMTVIDGVRSFEGLRRRAKIIRLGDTQLRVAAGRAGDLAVLEVLERTLDEESRLKKGQAGSSQERG